MQQEKYGFVYIWFDKKRKMFYVGRHWGTEDDGYICSSNNMRANYNQRPHDFRRKVIARVYNKEQLVIEEQRWLNMIKPVECKYKYYNVTLSAKTATMHGRKHSEETIQKMRMSAKGKPKSAEHKEKIRQARLGKKHKLESIEKIRVNSHTARDYNDPVFRAKMSFAARNRTKETRKKLSEATKQRRAAGTFGKGIKAIAK